VEIGYRNRDAEVSDVIDGNGLLEQALAEACA